MKPFIFNKLEMDRPKEELARFEELAQADLSRVSGGGSVTTCTYSPGAPGNDVTSCDEADNSQPDCPPPDVLV